MARTVANFTFAGRQANKIDFSPWADGQIWQLVEGEDFSIESKKVGGKARSWAKKNGKSVQVSAAKTDDGKPCVYVKFSPLAGVVAPASSAAPPAEGFASSAPQTPAEPPSAPEQTTAKKAKSGSRKAGR